MLSKNKIKFINSLKLKKNRDKESLFIAEGSKIVSEILSSGLNIPLISATSDWISKNEISPSVEVLECSNSELKKITTLTTASDVIAVVLIPKNEYSIDKIKSKLSLALDDIQDPGNLGTIIRLADWFGIENIFCSKNTADIYNPKVIQATMGSFLRVKTHYVNLTEFLNKQIDIPVFGTFMKGENIYNQDLSNTGIIVMGNEGNGISLSIEKLITHKIAIPPANKKIHPESLNVGTATGIILSEFLRRRN